MCCAGTRSPSREETPARVRRVRGCLIGNRGALRPQEAVRPPRGPLRVLWDLAVPGVALRHPRAAICVPLQALASRSPNESFTVGLEPFGRSPARRPLLVLCRKRSQRASWISSHLALLPGAGRLHVKDGCAFHVPSQQATRASSHGAARAGISTAVAPLCHLPSALTRHQSALGPALHAGGMSSTWRHDVRWKSFANNVIPRRRDPVHVSTRDRPRPAAPYPRLPGHCSTDTIPAARCTRFPPPRE